MGKKIAIPTDAHYHNEVLLDPERILCNDVVLPGEPNPRKRQLFVVFHEHGAMGAVFADHEEEALDELVDADLGAGILLDEESLASYTEEEREHFISLGNHGQPADVTNVMVVPARWNPAREKDLRLLLMLAEARGAGATTLGDL